MAEVTIERARRLMWRWFAAFAVLGAVSIGMSFTDIYEPVVIALTFAASWSGYQGSYWQGWVHGARA